MNILTIPLSNIRNKWSKTLLLVLVFTLGIASIVVLYQVSLVVGESLERKLNTYGANIIISPRSESLSVSYGGFSMGDMLYDIQELKEKETIASIRQIELQDRISVIAPKLVAVMEIQNTPVTVVGVRWFDELGIKSYWAIDGEIPQQENQLILGSSVAHILEISQGQELIIQGKAYEVAGVLQATGGDEDHAVFMGISRLQKELNRPDGLSFIEIAALCSGCPIEDIVGQLKEKLPQAEVKALQNIVNQRMESVHFVQKLAWAVSIVILVTAATMIALSMLSAVNERKKDIGILRSLGFARIQVFTIFCAEAGFIGIVSGLSGYLIGYFSTFTALDFLKLSENFSPLFSGLQLAACVLFLLLLPFWQQYILLGKVPPLNLQKHWFHSRRKDDFSKKYI